MDLVDRRFLIIKEGKPSGPFSLEEMKKMHLNPSDFVKDEHADDYKELREIPEVCQLLSIPYEAALPQYYASMDMRLLAWAIDFFIVFGAICIFLILPITLYVSEDSRIGLIIISLLLLIPVQFIMSVMMESSERQGTFGKIMIRVKVCDVKGLPVSFAKSFLRNCYKLLGFLSLGIGFFIGFFDRKQQCLHDKLAGTLVIKDRLI